MNVEIETTFRVLIENAEKDLLLDTLTYIVEERQNRIRAFREKIESYERKRERERNAYQQMSTVRRWLASRTPEHHLAVEHLVYVKQPMMEIQRLADEISRLQKVAEAVKAGDAETVYVPAGCSQELLDKYEERERKHE